MQYLSMLFKEALQKLCKREPWSPAWFGSWVPVRMCTAVQLLALVEKCWCHRIKKLSQMTRAAFVKLTTFPDHQGGESTLTHGHGASVRCCHEQWNRDKYSNLKALPDQKSPDFLKWQCLGLDIWGWVWLFCCVVFCLFGLVWWFVCFFWRKREKIWRSSRWAG